MKICIVTTSYHPYNTGGGEYSAKQLAEGLIEMGLDVFVIAAYKEREELSTINGVRVYRIKSPNVYWSAEADSKSSLQKLLWHATESYNTKVHQSIEDILKKEKPDVVHVRNITDFSAYIWKSCKRLGMPSVTTLNNYASICIKTTLLSGTNVCEQRCLSCKLVSLPKKHLSKYADAVVGVSEFTLNEHLKYGFFKNAKKFVIRTQVPFIESYVPEEKKQLTFGYIGQISENKGVLSLITAFKANRNMEIKLIIAGKKEGEYYQYCEKEACNDKRIQFIGKVESDRFYKQVDVVIIPSIWFEPFPRVLVEAYSYGLPVITTGQGGIKELVFNNKTGYLYSNINELTNLISEISKSGIKRDLIVSNIKELVYKDCKSDLKRYCDVYKELIN